MANFVIKSFITPSPTLSQITQNQKWVGVGGDGLPRVVYFSKDGNTLHYVQFLDAQGNSVVDNVVANDGTNGGIYSVVMVIGSDGFARIVYNTNGGTDVHLLICQSNDGLTNTDVLLEGGVNPFEFSIVLDASDNVNVVYNEYNSHKIKLARCNADGTNVQISNITDFTLGTTFGLGLANDGFLRIAYGDKPPTVASYGLYYLKCTSSDGTAFSSNCLYTAIANDTDVPYNLDMVLASDNTARIVFPLPLTFSNSPGMNYIKCNNETGSSFTKVVLDSYVSSHTIGPGSICLSSEGLPRIVYGNAISPDASTDYVRYVEFNADDTSSYTITTLDSLYNGNEISVANGRGVRVAAVYRTTDQKDFRIAIDYISNLFLQTTLMVGSEVSDIQTLNAGKNDDGTVINYELETQGIEFGNAFHRKHISDKIVVFTKNGMDSNLQGKTDNGNYEDIEVDLDKQVNISKSVDLEGNTMKLKWYGEANESSPVLEGFYIEQIDDKGVTHD